MRFTIRGGEPRIRGHPFGERAAPLGVGCAERQFRVREKELRLHPRSRRGGIFQIGHVVLRLRTPLAVGIRPAPFARPIFRHDFERPPRRHIHRLHGDPWKERGQLVELLALPAVGLVVVALGALQLDAEENARHFGRCLFGAPVLAIWMAVAPFSRTSPVAVMNSVAILSHGSFSLNFSVSVTVSGFETIAARSSSRRYMITSRQ